MSRPSVVARIVVAGVNPEGIPRAEPVPSVTETPMFPPPPREMVSRFRIIARDDNQGNLVGR